MLLNAGLDLFVRDRQGRYPLHCMIEDYSRSTEHVEMFWDLFKCTKHREARDGKGRTPLLLALATC